MAANTDKFKKLARRWVGQIGSAGVVDGVTTTITLNSGTNLPTDTAVEFTIDRVNSDGDPTASLEETCTGVASGDTIISCVRGVEGTAQAHAAGAVVEILFTASGYNDLIDGLLVEHNQDGTQKSLAASIITSGTMATARLGSGTANATTFLRGDQTWATPTAASGTFTQYGNMSRDNTSGELVQDSSVIFRWPNTGTTYATYTGVVPNDWASGNITVTYYFLSQDDNNTRKMTKTGYIRNPTTGASVTWLSATNFDHTVSSTYSDTLAAADITAGSRFSIIIQRNGDDGSDTGGRLDLVAIRFSYTANNVV